MAEDVWARYSTGAWRYTVSIVGAVLAAVAIVSVPLDGRVTGTELLQIASLVVLSGLLVVAGWRIARDVEEPPEVARVLGWMSAGVIALAALGVWFELVSRTADTAFQSALVFLSPLAAGTLFGAIVGYYDVRVCRLVERASRESARREFLAEQQESLSTLNAIMRHQVLNDLSAIAGQAELLRLEKAGREDAAETIHEKTDHLVSIVHRLETIADVLGEPEDPGTTPVGDAIDRAVADAREDHPEATFVDGSDSGARVVADHLLAIAVYEVLDNAARHAGSAPTVRVGVADGDPVVIRVADDGPGIDISPLERAIEPSQRGVDSDGDGLGLFLAETILDRYGGEIALSNDGDGAVVELRVPAA